MYCHRQTSKVLPERFSPEKTKNEAFDIRLSRIAKKKKKKTPLLPQAEINVEGFLHATHRVKITVPRSYKDFYCCKQYSNHTDR